jgi:hypothetical protein
VVRFYRDGSPAVLLRSFEGKPINIVRRRLAGEPKVLALNLSAVLGGGDDVMGTLSTRGTMVDWIGDIDPDGVDVAVLVEGVTDALAACLAFPTCAVVGANGAGRMVDVARAIAPRLVPAGGWLMVCVDADKQGIAGAGEALADAVDAGLVLGESVRTIELGEHHDLADAWRAGWRYDWPAIGGAT